MKAANKTTILFDAANTTKSRTFGSGLMRSAPTYTEVAKLADELAAEQMFRESRAFDAIVDRMSNEAQAMDRRENGPDA